MQNNVSIWRRLGQDTTEKMLRMIYLDHTKLDAVYRCTPKPEETRNQVVPPQVELDSSNMEVMDPAWKETRIRSSSREIERDEWQ